MLESSVPCKFQNHIQSKLWTRHFWKMVFAIKLQRKSSPFCQQVLIALSETWHLGVTLLTARVINFNQRGGEGMINY